MKGKKDVDRPALRSQRGENCGDINEHQHQHVQKQTSTWWWRCKWKEGGCHWTREQEERVAGTVINGQTRRVCTPNSSLQHKTVSSNLQCKSHCWFKSSHCYQSRRVCTPLHNISLKRQTLKSLQRSDLRYRSQKKRFDHSFHRSDGYLEPEMRKY